MMVISISTTFKPSFYLLCITPSQRQEQLLNRRSNSMSFTFVRYRWISNAVNHRMHSNLPAVCFYDLYLFRSNFELNEMYNKNSYRLYCQSKFFSYSQITHTAVSIFFFSQHCKPWLKYRSFAEYKKKNSLRTHSEIIPNHKTRVLGEEVV